MTFPERRKAPIRDVPGIYRDWTAMALANIRAGHCPNHYVPLTDRGFCFACEIVYSIRDRTTVVATYAWAFGFEVW